MAKKVATRKVHGLVVSVMFVKPVTAGDAVREVRELLRCSFNVSKVSIRPIKEA